MKTCATAIAVLFVAAGSAVAQNAPTDLYPGTYEMQSSATVLKTSDTCPVQNQTPVVMFVKYPGSGKAGLALSFYVFPTTASSFFATLDGFPDVPPLEQKGLNGLKDAKAKGMVVFSPFHRGGAVTTSTATASFRINYLPAGAIAGGMTSFGAGSISVAFKDACFDFSLYGGLVRTGAVKE